MSCVVPGETPLSPDLERVIDEFMARIRSAPNSRRTLRCRPYDAVTRIIRDHDPGDEHEERP